MLVFSIESQIERRIPWELVKYVLDKFQGHEDWFFLEFEVPAHIQDLDCPLYGETMGDEPVPEQVVTWEKFPGSPAKHRIVHKPMRKTRVATVLAGPDSHGHACVIKELYAGPKRAEPVDDPSIKSEQHRAAVAGFWQKHAMSHEAF